MNEKTFLTLEYNHIKERLHGYCMSYLGREKVQSLQPSIDLRLIQAWLLETEEAAMLAGSSSSIPIPTLDGIDAVMRALNKGVILSADQLGQFIQFLDSTTQLKQYMVRKQDVAPHVPSYAMSLILLDNVRDEIRRCVQHGEVLDTASDALERIRKQIHILEERVRRKLESAMQKYKAHLQEGFYSRRGDRFVLPIKRDSKRLIRGTILDQSASGQTVYIEPEEISATQEELSEAHFAEEQEKSRILSQLTGLIEANQEAIRRNLEVIGHYDFLFAKAKLARSMEARRPNVNASSRIHIKEGRHPLLGKDAKPVDFYIGEGFQALIITGPNTGGKTVTLKTVGLLTLMVQSGLLVPLGAESELAVFHHILADIGDGQNIEQSLSTFSAHVKGVIDILKVASKRSLVLLDELAAGTDPGEGIGLSIAVLESLKAQGATIVATTHFNEIKRFADATDGFENARMLFDEETLQPLYALDIGQAGKSYALLIAEKLGVPKGVVERAKALAVPSSLAPPTSRHVPASPARTSSLPVERIDETANEKERGYLKGDRVWIHPLKTSGIFVETVDERGTVRVLVKKQPMLFNIKRITPYLTREELYPDFDRYDLDIVVESKDTRRKRKLMSKHHVEGVSIEHPESLSSDTNGRNQGTIE